MIRSVGNGFVITGGCWGCYDDDCFEQEQVDAVEGGSAFSFGCRSFVNVFD